MSLRALSSALALLLAAPAAAQAPPPAPPAQPPAPVPVKVIVSPEASQAPAQQDKDRAEAIWEAGDELYGKGRYKEAIEKYKEAHEIIDDSELLYSIAVAYEQLQAWQECVKYMDRFLEGAKVGPKMDRAKNTRESCDARIERDQLLIISSDPRGAKVYVDDRTKGVRGTTPFRNYMRPGAHKVWVELPGYEVIEQDIDVQVKEPFRLNLALRKVQNVGYLFLDCTIIGATVFIDGKNIGLSPFKEPLAYPAGRHQVVVDRDGYTRFDQHISVEKGATTTVDAHLVRTDFVSTWRSPVGWTANVVGLLGIAGGVVAWQFADKEFNDTDKFDELAGWEKLGYGVGGGLLFAGTTLIIWDRARDVVLDRDRNPAYGDKAPRPPGSVSFRPTGSGLSFTF